MLNLDPNEMDALFKEGAEKHEFSYNEDAWLLMEKKLDNQARKRTLWWLFAGLLFLGVAMVTYFTVSTPEHSTIDEYTETTNVIANNNTAKNTSSPVSAEIAAIDHTIIKTRRSKTKIDESNKHTTADEVDQETYIPTDSKVRRGNIGAHNNLRSNTIDNTVIDNVVNNASQVNQTIQNINIASSSVATVDALNKFVSVPSENSNNTNTQVAFENLETLGQRSLNPLAYTSSFEGALFVTPFDKNAEETSSSGMSFTLFAHPEWSSIGLFNETKTGWNVGGRMGYLFGNKWEISAGLAYSRKIYKGAGKEYTMDGGWFEDIEPMRMDAKCDIIEIPLSLSYFMNGNTQNGFFMDLGITSYMLHSEWYGFEYDDALIRPSKYLEVNEEDTNSHLVGAGRIALGYQKMITGNSIIQVSPYLQFPLTGIGAGSVNLYSSGVQIAIKFH